MKHGFRESWVIVALFLAPALLGLALFRLAPILIALIGGFTGTRLTGETVWVGLRNYERLVSDPAFWNSVRITLLFNVIINPLQILIALGLALLVLRPTPLVPLFRAAYMAPMTVSLSLTSILWAILLEPTMGPVNGLLRALGVPPQPFWRSEEQALATLIAVASWKGVGYWMVFLLAGLLLVPKELHEAAMIDGASAWQRFRWVTLPLMRRPLAFVLVADTAANFLLFAPMYLITQGGPNGATALLMFEAYQAAFTYLDRGRALALSTVILLVIGLLAVLELRLLRERES